MAGRQEAAMSCTLVGVDGSRKSRLRASPSPGVRRILVGVDGSKESRDAAFYAAELAKATGAKLIVACAGVVHGLFTGPELIARTAHWEEEEQERGDAVVKEVAAAVARPGIEVETLVAGGPAAATLAWMAKGHDVDLVVVGHRSRGALARLVLGSVADRLVQICPKPVLIVH